MNNKIIIGGIVVAILLSIVSILVATSKPETLGGTTTLSGPINSLAGFNVNGTSTISSEGIYLQSASSTGEFTIGNLIQGGSITTLTASGNTENASTTISAANVCDSSVLVHTSGTATLATTTLPSETSLITDCLLSLGSIKQIYYVNAGDAASTTLITAGTDIILMKATGTTNVIIAGGSQTLITFIRQAASTTYAIVQEVVDAD